MSESKLGIHAECPRQIHNASDLQSSNLGKAILIATRCATNHLQQLKLSRVYKGLGFSSLVMRDTQSRHTADRSEQGHPHCKKQR